MGLRSWNEGGNYNESNVDKRSWRCEESERNPSAICSDSAQWVVGKVEIYLDGLRLIEDITFDDSVGHEIIALNDGSYIMLENGQATLYGEAYRIKDRQLTQICKDGEFISL